MRLCVIVYRYILPEGIDLLNDLRHTYRDGALPGGPRDNYLGRHYTWEMTPNAKWYVEHMLRWTFTDKYTDEDVEDIIAIVWKVAERYRR